MQKNNIIFLDFDGVIRLGASDESGENPLFSKRACGLINRLCDMTGAKIVVTSDLRKYNPFDTIAGLMKLVPIDWYHYHTEWTTPAIDSNKRCMEIAYWMLADDYNFICIDDDQEIYKDEKIKSHCIWTNYRNGFTQKEFEEALKRLK